MHKSYQLAVETPTLRTSHDDLLTCDIAIFICTQKLTIGCGDPTLRTAQDITTCIYIYKRSSTHTEYGIENLASPGIPGIELEKRYLEYLRIQLTPKNLHSEYRWTI